MVSPLDASIICVVPSKAPTAPPATVAKLLEMLVSVTVPVPFNDKPLAVMGWVWVIAAEERKVISSLVAVKAPLMATVPPEIKIGPETVVVLAIVIFAVFVVLPMVKPLNVLAKVRLAEG